MNVEPSCPRGGAAALPDRGRDRGDHHRQQRTARTAGREQEVPLGRRCAGEDAARCHDHPTPRASRPRAVPRRARSRPPARLPLGEVVQTDRRAAPGPQGDVGELGVATRRSVGREQRDVEHRVGVERIHDDEKRVVALVGAWRRPKPTRVRPRPRTAPLRCRLRPPRRAPPSPRPAIRRRSRRTSTTIDRWRRRVTGTWAPAGTTTSLGGRRPFGPSSVTRRVDVGRRRD